MQAMCFKLYLINECPLCKVMQAMCFKLYLISDAGYMLNKIHSINKTSLCWSPQWRARFSKTGTVPSCARALLGCGAVIAHDPKTWWHAHWASA